jgi:hypothetical protein
VTASIRKPSQKIPARIPDCCRVGGPDGESARWQKATTGFLVAMLAVLSSEQGMAAQKREK